MKGYNLLKSKKLIWSILASLVITISAFFIPYLLRDDTPITERSFVCMVKDKYRGYALESVEIDGKNYYGCCQRCLSKIQANPALQIAIDPVSGNQVDKATYLMGLSINGSKVEYFESEKNFKSYKSKLYSL